MKKVIRMILTLSIIGIFSGGVLSKINDWAVPYIEANKKAATEKAISLVQPEGKNYERIKEAPFEAYKVFDEQNNLIGYSLVYEGNGFQGKIRLMAGVSVDLNKITALEILEQVETPGLGTKVTKEPFTSQFNNLITTPQIDWVKGVKPDKPNEIQAITGATISSKAVVAIINSGIDQLRNFHDSGVK
jgi:electron transport complex protein RnfG